MFYTFYKYNAHIEHNVDFSIVIFNLIVIHGVIQMKSYRNKNILYNVCIIYYFRVSVTASCPMRLQKYPMDFQICPLYIQSCE